MSVALLLCATRLKGGCAQDLVEAGRNPQCVVDLCVAVEVSVDWPARGSQTDQKSVLGDSRRVLRLNLQSRGSMKFTRSFAKAAKALTLRLSSL